MLLNQFHSRFPTEEACIDYFKSVRMQQGVVCPCCNDVTDKWLEGRNAFQCKKCGCSIPLTKGTVMEHSKLSLSTWFYTMHLMTSVKQGYPQKRFSTNYEPPQYPPVWLMMMKLPQHH
ncbi:transposase, partial [Bacteroides thetaiotaomicron]|uniref:transposase n=1 Tax=Bacteroides thetaiotaomicron TaxID=818 RepID=UPI0011121B3A